MTSETQAPNATTDALDIEDITPRWLNDVLGYEVASFTSEKVGAGQTGASYRLTLHTAQGGESHGELVRRGAADYGFDQCFRDYCLGQLQATMITTIGCIYATRERSDASDAMFLAMARRSCAAIRDLGTLDLL